MIPARGHDAADKSRSFATRPSGSSRPSRRSPARPTSRRGSRIFCARKICRPGCAKGPIPISPHCPGRRRRSTSTKGRAQAEDRVGLSHAFAGIAETGTLALVSGPDNPTTLNFLPETHIVVVEAQTIVGDYEAFWAKLRAAYGEGTMPRTVNFITGPSRSADIEQTLLLGAHGPRTLHILIVDAAI